MSASASATGDLVLQTMQTIRAEQLARNDGEVNPVLFVVRDGRIVMHAVLTASREQAIRGFLIAATGFSAERLIFADDAYVATAKYIRERGLDGMKPGTLGRLFEAGRTDLVAEALVCCEGTRDGRRILTQLPYDRLGDGGVAWHAPATVEGTGLGGAVIDGIAAGFRRATFDAIAEQLGADRLEQDITAAKLFAESCPSAVVLYPSDEDQLLRIADALSADPNFSWRLMETET